MVKDLEKGLIIRRISEILGRQAIPGDPQRLREEEFIQLILPDVEKEFGIRIPDGDKKRLNTYGDVLGYLLERKYR